MPAHAKDGKVVCFLAARVQFNARYATFSTDAGPNPARE
jgi:hypothetical protein